MTKTHLEHIALLLRLVLITFFTLIFTELCIVLASALSRTRYAWFATA